MSEIPPVDSQDRRSFIITGLVGSDVWLYLNNARFHMVVDTLADVVIEMADRMVKSCKQDIEYQNVMRSTSGPRRDIQ